MIKSARALAFVTVLALPIAATANVVISQSTTATTFTSNILGPGVTVIGTPTYIGVTNQSGTFTNGLSSGIGFDSGIVLSTGNVNQIPGPNNTSGESVGGGGVGNDDVSTDLGRPGDAHLTSLVGASTFDAAVLRFQFQLGDGTQSGNLFFRFVFASEEYIDYIGSQYNDIFGLFVDDVNIAVLPGTSTPVAINNVNCDTNSAHYRNNVPGNCAKPNLNLDISFDGLTTVLVASRLNLGPGVHTMEFAIADTSDGILDSAVFIEAGSFSTNNPIPEPGSVALLGLGLAGLALARRRKGMTASGAPLQSAPVQGHDSRRASRPPPP